MLSLGRPSARLVDETLFSPTGIALTLNATLPCRGLLAPDGRLRQVWMVLAHRTIIGGLRFPGTGSDIALRV